MWHRTKILACLVLTSFAGPAITEIAVLDGDFNEDLLASANTGGARVIGLQVDGVDVRAELKVMLPTSWKDKPFCVRTRSSDALYNSENTYRRQSLSSDSDGVPQASSEPIEIPHIGQTEHQDSLMAIVKDGFGVRIFLSACANVTDATQSTVALWRDGTFTQNITLFVNSFGAQRLVAILTQGAVVADPIDCTPIVADVKVAYDKTCNLKLLATSGPAEVELLGFKDGKMQRPEFLLFRLP